MIQIVKYEENNVMYLGNYLEHNHKNVKKGNFTFSKLKPKNDSLSVNYYFSI